MVTAKCNRCLGFGTGSTFEEASSKINHAVGISRGVPCGRSFNKVVEVGGSTLKPKAKKTPKASVVKPAVEKPTPKPHVEKSSSPIYPDKE